MQQLLFALVVTICPAHEPCADVVYEVYDSKQECEHVIFERRIFTGNCYEVDSIISKS